MKTPPTIHELRKSGWKVRVHHFRYYYRTLIPSNDRIFTVGQPLPKGGLTKIELTSPLGTQYLGQAECSKKDSFNRKLGVKIALGRALSTISEMAKDVITTE